jgi:hypothetical protein
MIFFNLTIQAAVLGVLALLTFYAFAEENGSEAPPAPDPRVAPASAPQRDLPAWQHTGLKRRSSRWGILSDLGISNPSIFDPYNLNPLKGDFPLFGKRTFMVMTGVFVPKALFNNQENARPQFNNDVVAALEFFRGATVFEPKKWSLKGSGKAIFNRGNGKDAQEFAILELFGELKLFNVGSNFDFTSTRNGFQFFKTDFNGFIFQDFNLGYQLFGELSKNRFQWALAFADLRVKENGLLTFNPLNREVFFANWFWEDFLKAGFNTVFSFHYNRDRSNPASSLDVYYAGFASAGHWGRWVFSPAFYYAFGKDQNQGNEQTISAFLTGIEIAYPLNFLNYRGAVFYTSGDGDPNDNAANGFASINEAINLFGAGNSFLIGGNAFTNANSFIPANQGVSTFVNPGILLLNAGLDIVFTPKLFFTSNANFAQFIDVASLEKTENKDIGYEVNAAFNYRLFLNENFIIQAGANAFFPRKAGIDILGSDQTVITTNVALQLVY